MERRSEWTSHFSLPALRERKPCLPVGINRERGEQREDEKIENRARHIFIGVFILETLFLFCFGIGSGKFIQGIFIYNTRILSSSYGHKSQARAKGQKTPRKT